MQVTGISLPPLGSVSKQLHELQLATNYLGPYLLFSQKLSPSLQAAAPTSSSGSARVVWTSLFVVDLTATNGGVSMADVTSPSTDQKQKLHDFQSGRWFLASEPDARSRPTWHSQSDTGPRESED